MDPAEELGALLLGVHPAEGLPLPSPINLGVAAVTAGLLACNRLSLSLGSVQTMGSFIVARNIAPFLEKQVVSDRAARTPDLSARPPAKPDTRRPATALGLPPPHRTAAAALMEKGSGKCFMPFSLGAFPGASRVWSCICPIYHYSFVNKAHVCAGAPALDAECGVWLGAHTNNYLC